MARWGGPSARDRHLLLVSCFLMAFLGSLAAEEVIHSKLFNSPGFVLGPGDVIDQYIPVDMPTGHIAIRELFVQLVDGSGTPIRLSDTYLHHWVLVRAYIDPKATTGEFLPVANDGTCNPYLIQYFGLGSETRHTKTGVPSPYGIVVGNPDDVPPGMLEMWLLNVHAIDTRGVLSRSGCIECVCELYNQTTDVTGKPLPSNYVGGLYCCHDGTHCPVHPGFQGSRRELFLQISVKWVDYSDAVVPAMVYILDSTDTRQKWDDPSGCEVEYDVPKCAEGSLDCVHEQKGFAFLPKGGYVIYIDAHLHNAGVSGSIHRANGEELCISYPKYGTGDEAGNEEGYVVGMSTCYPEPGSMYVAPREKLQLNTVYNSTETHTGVMGLFYILVAEKLPHEAKSSHGAKTVTQRLFDAKVMGGVLVGVCVLALASLLVYGYKKNRAFRYQPI